MLDIGFRDDIRKILGHLKQKHQTLFVSATISHEITKNIPECGNNRDTTNPAFPGSIPSRNQNQSRSQSIRIICYPSQSHPNQNFRFESRSRPIPNRDAMGCIPSRFIPSHFLLCVQTKGTVLVCEG